MSYLINPKNPVAASSGCYIDCPSAGCIGECPKAANCGIN